MWRCVIKDMSVCHTRFFRIIKTQTSPEIFKVSVYPSKNTGVICKKHATNKKVKKKTTAEKIPNNQNDFEHSILRN